MVQTGCAGGTPGTAGQPEEAATLRCYCDASFSPYGEHSFTGVCLMWRGSALLWRAVKQSMVAQSTAEAELLAMASGLQVAQAIQEVVNELGVWDATQVTILGDNAAAIALAKTGAAGAADTTLSRPVPCERPLGMNGQHSSGWRASTRSPIL